jgi:hypothetical protein
MRSSAPTNAQLRLSVERHERKPNLRPQADIQRAVDGEASGKGSPVIDVHEAIAMAQAAA